MENKSLFICTSQYQVFNCLSIAKSREDNPDLLVLNYDGGILKKLNFTGLKKIFSNIYTYDICPITASARVRYSFWAKEIINKNSYGINYQVGYKDVFISGTEMHSKIAAMKCESKGAKVHYFEDGLESYDALLDESYKYKQDTILKLIYGNRALDVCQDMYVHLPELVRNNSLNKSIVKIQNLQELYTWSEVQTCFSDECKPFKRRIVFLNAWFKDAEMYEEQRCYIDLLDSVTGGDFSIKKHPNEIRVENEPCNQYEDCGNFELANYRYDMSDKVFISIISTACLSPSILFNRTPYIIFLYKIFEAKFEMPEWTETDKVIKNFVDFSGMENRIFIPSTLGEYREILQQIY